MSKRIFVLFLALSLLLIFPALATKVDKDALEATHVLIGKVKSVDSYYDSNKWGDTLIYSQVGIKVEKKLKGEIEDFVDFIVEGGTVGEITLKVSEYPLFTEGEKVKLYLKKTDHIFKFMYSETIEDEEALAKKGGKPGAPACCKTFARWLNTDVLYHINPANNDVSGNCAVGDIVDGAGAWNSACKINLIYDKSPGAGTVAPNYINDIFFRPESSGSTIAVTYTWYYRKTREIIEFDMVFYDGAWKFFGLHCDGGCFQGFYIQTIATHELGHAIGIDHNRCTTSIMYPYASYCETNALSAEDAACASSLYK